MATAPDTQDAASSAPEISLRAFLEHLTACGDVLRVRREVSPHLELGAILWHFASGPAVYFERAQGAAMPVIGNVLNSRPRFGAALGIPWRAVYERTLQALDHPIPPVLVDQGPCQDIQSDVDLERLPIPHWFEGESGPYITAGVIVAHDPASGRRNVSIARLQPRGKAEAFIGIAPNHHLSVFARRAAAQGRALEIAVTIGQHPAIILASNLYLRPGDDEFDYAGGLLGRPIPLVRCRTIDVEVPAAGEMVLEGCLDPSTVLEEGPVSEFHGLYQHYGHGLLVRFSALTTRREPLFQVIGPGYQPEHLLIGAIGIAATCGRVVRAALPEGDAHVVITEASGGRLHAVISLRSLRPGDARKAMFAVWGHVNLVKHIVVVDDDIDPYDPRAVEYAVSTRVRADRDILVVPGVRGDRADPMVSEGLVSKLGLDATRKAHDRADWTPAQPSQDLLERIAAEFAPSERTP